MCSTSGKRISRSASSVDGLRCTAPGSAVSSEDMNAMPFLQNVTFNESGQIVRQKGTAKWISTPITHAKMKITVEFCNANGKALFVRIFGAAPKLTVGHNVFLQNSVKAAFRVVKTLYLDHLRKCGVPAATIERISSALTIDGVELSWHLPRSSRRAVDAILARLIKHLDILDIDYLPVGKRVEQTLYIHIPEGEIRIYRKLPQLRASKRVAGSKAAIDALGSFVDKGLRIELILDAAYLKANGLDKATAWTTEIYPKMYAILLKRLGLDRPPLTKRVGTADLGWPPSMKDKLDAYFDGTFDKQSYNATAVSRFRMRAKKELHLVIDVEWALHRKLPVRLADSFAYHRRFQDFAKLPHSYFSAKAATVALAKLK